VVVPVYRAALDPHETLSLDRCFRVLGRHHLVMVKPEGLDTAALERRWPFARVETFAPEHLASIEGYNRLLLSPAFYERFLGSEYLLICQLDVFVFRDDLAGWLARGHDYVGAPWISSSPLSAAIHRAKFELSRRLLGPDDKVHPHELRDRVGNGGFSLRRVAFHHRLSSELADTVERYVRRQGTHHFHEDVFWSVEPERHGVPRRAPSAREALAFAFDINPARLYRLAGEQLPMAAHGWSKRRNLRFWAPHVAATGATLP
jgi:hypothetical protein